MSTYSYSMPSKMPTSQGGVRNNYTINHNDLLDCPQRSGNVYPVYSVSSTAAQGTIDVLKERIEKLEKEKIQLTQVNLLFVQQLNEREIKYKKRIEICEADIEERKSAQLRLSACLHESEEHVKILKHGKEELFLAVVNLNERIEMQNKTAAEAQTIWAKLPAAIKALKRLDDEAVKLRREKTESDAEKERQSKMVAKLQEAAEERLVEMTLLKSKMETERSYFNSVKLSLEETNANTTGAIACLVDKLDESKATNVREKVSFHSERNALFDELERLRSQLTTRSMILESMNTPHKDDPQVDFRGKESFLAFVDDLKNNLLKSEMKRKLLHNQLQDLRGNIRVFVRTRPFLSCDGNEQFSDRSDPNIGGCVKFYKDNSSVSLLAAPQARDKPQVKSNLSNRTEFFKFKYYAKLFI